MQQLSYFTAASSYKLSPTARERIDNSSIRADGRPSRVKPLPRPPTHDGYISGAPLTLYLTGPVTAACPSASADRLRSHAWEALNPADKTSRRRRLHRRRRDLHGGQAIAGTDNKHRTSDEAQRQLSGADSRGFVSIPREFRENFDEFCLLSLPQKSCCCVMHITPQVK